MAENERSLLAILLEEKANRRKGGIYHKIQVDFAYNSNHIEGSRLTHEQTRYIYETMTVGGDAVRVNDIQEAVSHFRCFDCVLDTVDVPITHAYIKELHRILKAGTVSAQSFDAVIGDYKKYPNIVGDLETTAPERVEQEMDALLHWFASVPRITIYDILDFHARFEQIHPFYDGNGRVGRLLMLKQCLAAGIVPFLIDGGDKLFYYRGLQEWQKPEGEKGYLIDTCLAMQDRMRAVLDYFRIAYDKTEITQKDVMNRNL